MLETANRLKGAIMKFMCQVEHHQTLMVGDRVRDENGSFWEVVERFNNFPYFVLKNCLGGNSVIAQCPIENEPHQHECDRCYLVLVEADYQRQQRYPRLQRKAS